MPPPNTHTHTPTHLPARVWQPEHVALSKVAVRRDDRDVHHDGQAAEEALERVGVGRLQDVEQLAERLAAGCRVSAPAALKAERGEARLKRRVRRLFCVGGWWGGVEGVE